jgi:hypothetical protein
MACKSTFSAVEGPKKSSELAEQNITTIFKEERAMVKAKKGDVLSCEVCGLIVTVDDTGLDMAEIDCCKMSMAKGKAAADKAKKKTLLAVAKAPAKAVKPVAAKAKAPVKPAAKAAPKAKAKAPVKPAAKAAPKAKAKAPAKKPAAKKPAAAKAPVKTKK